MRFFNTLFHVLMVGGVIILCLATESRAQGDRDRRRNRNRNDRRGGGGQNNASDNDFDANVELEKFGYLDDTPNHQHSEDNIRSALREFQRFNGLNVTGSLDRPTVFKMQQPRCGIKDVVKPRQRPSHFRSNQGVNAPLAFHAPGYKWNNNQVSYRVDSFTSQLNTGDQSRAFANAFRKWSDVSPLTFRRTNGEADIIIKYAVRQHEDGPGNAFDGLSGVLAHAFFPGANPLSGDTHFDDEEEWTLREDRGTNLEIVAAHEFGHALGLGHSATPAALMAPYYPGYNPNYGLHDDDIRGIQRLYGGAPRRTTPRPRVTTRRPRTRRPTTRRPRTRRPTTRRPRTRRPTTRRPRTRRPTTSRPRVTPRPTGPHCSLRFDAIEQIHDGRILAFRDRSVYTITRNGPTNETRTRRLFPGAPRSPGAVVYDRYGRHLYFFKGRRYWKYRQFTKLPGYPRTLPTDFQRIKAAMQWRDGGIYVFKGREYTRWVERLGQYPSGYPRSARDYWNRFPTNPDAAFRSYDGYYYVFKYFRYWRYNSSAQMSAGFPKDSRPVWLNCRRTSRMTSQSMSSTNLFSFLTPEINNGITTD